MIISTVINFVIELKKGNMKNWTGYSPYRVLPRPAGRRLIKGMNLLQTAFKNKKSEDFWLERRSVDKTDFLKIDTGVERSIFIVL